MAEQETNLDKYLHTVRRIEEHREERAVNDLKKLYKRLVRQYRAQMGEIYAQYADTVTGQLNYAQLHTMGLDARLLEEVAANMNDVTLAEKKLITQLVEETYNACYSAMTEATQRAVDDDNLAKYFSQVESAKPQALKAAVDNPVHGLTLSQQLEKNRADIVYTVKQAVGVGLSVGDRYDTMARRIQTALIGPDGAGGSYAKSVRIARTEAHRCREQGNLDAAENLTEKLQPAGVTMMKTWHTMKDERVRPNHTYKTKKGWKQGKSGKYNHVAMEGVSIPINEKFKLPSGAETMAPGQSGVAGEDINCRCFLSYTVRKESLQEPIEDDKIKINAEAADAVEDAIGVKKNTPMTIAEAATGANPNYEVDPSYRVNCQRCVQAYELRRRGYDVIARNRPNNEFNTIKWGSECFLPAGVNPLSAFTLSQTAEQVKQELELAPDGARYVIYIQWQTGAAHVFMAEKEGKRIKYIDPQNGKQNVQKYFDYGIKNGFGFYRVDDKKITDSRKIISATVEAKKE